MSLTWNALLAIVLVALITRVLRSSRRPKDFPPGPPTLPVIGNLHLIPKENPHLKFKEWAEKYGPVYSLVMGSRTVIVLNTDQAVKDLLDKRGNIYSSRPSSYIMSLATGDLNFTMMEYNNTWKLAHRLIATSLTPRSSQSYVPYQDLESKQMLFQLLQDPTPFRNIIQRYTYSVITQVVLGFRTTDMQDPRLLQFFHGFKEWSKLMGQAVSVLVDLFPVLRHLPDFLLPARRQAKNIHAAEKKLFLGVWEEVKEQSRMNTAKPCVAQSIHQAQLESPFSDGLAAYTCGFLLIAGSETIATQMAFFVEAMVLHPEIQQRAQAHLDAVCGDRMPAIDDDLPYIRALIKEICRWLPAAILGVPHAVTKEDEYLGYQIPRGAVVLLNVWAIHRDEKRYADPATFDPTRFLHDQKSARESALSNEVSERDHFLFGAGRRLCAGIDVAENALFLAFARLLWAFEIGPGCDADGREVLPDPEDLDIGLATAPKEFLARFVPRSEARRREVEREWEVARGLLDGKGQWR